MGTLIWLVLLTRSIADPRLPAHGPATSTIVLGALLVAYWLFGDGGFLWNTLLLALFVLLALLNVETIRRDNVTRRLFGIYRRMLPSMSKTEQEALEAGSVWWDGELFTGMPDWRRLKNLPPPKLTPRSKRSSTARPKSSVASSTIGRSRTSSPTCRRTSGSSSRRKDSSR